ncbi:MAG: hypothetical protein M1814_006004 [Vezdaea aestivalis]|nr:MAG: hypothetical protein M1814_006004 [Vezdaea aestivalis]
MSSHLVKTIHYKSYAAVDPTQASLSQKGKTVLITGGGQGVGPAIAHSFSQAGASNIVLLSRTAETLNKTVTSLRSAYPDTAFHAYPADITDEAAVSAAFKDYTSKVGPIDFLVNNAGAQGAAKPTVDADLADWWRTFEINVKGTTVVTQAFLKTRGEHKGGAIINLTTALSWAFTIPGMSAYTASKLAVVRLGEIVAAENLEITVVGLSPGVVRTRMWEAAGGEAMGFPITEAELPGNTTVWLTTSEAKFLSGRTLETNWDVTELKAAEKEIVENSLFVTHLAGWKDRVFPQYG